ncbi:MAG: molybdopterin-dependent oxidoreductase [Firmicutes bacterium]|nr:molybdopterin-dependent oxidoreductase [Bacillota bacterium]
MDKVKITLDGREVEVAAGTTILDAARQHGVKIPTLCHDPRLKPYAACRICLVDVEGSRGPLPACANSVSDGMKISTMNDNLAALRRVCLELLVSDHYGDCVAPCSLACPAGIDIQGQLALIADGQYKEALKLIKESNPLPSVCGRVCPRFCEKNCRRNLVDEPVAINSLKRFVADFDMAEEPYRPEVKPSTGHKVAIVGGGPAGLSAAYFLALEGHQVSIFDSNPKLGGMLRYGIPEYRLPKAELDKEIATITDLCEAVYLNKALGRDFTIESLKKEGFKAIFVALGAQASQKMRVEGEDLQGVLPGVNFLRDVALGNKIALGEKVAVIGGGNTAMDAARTALRLGARKVMVIYRRSRDEMPAAAEEVEEAEKEGVDFQFLSAPVKIVGEGGHVVGIECIKMELGEPDSSGRRRPVAVEGSQHCISVDTVIAAIGQALDMPELSDGETLKLSSRGYIEINKETMATSIEGVFGGGDGASGPATVVQAVGAGKRAAHSINLYVNGQAVVSPANPFNSSKGELSEIDPAEFADREKVPRAKQPMLTVEERKHNFREVEQGLSEEEAKKEAMRCLSCGCQDVFTCELRKLATEYRVDASTLDGEKHRLPIANDHPYIERDNNKCILCGRCARICSEVMGLGAITFVNRGFNTVVQPSLGLRLEETQCESCSQCISTCPTGALTAKVMAPKPGPWRTKDIPSVCPQCGINCSLVLKVKGNRVIKVSSPLGSAVNDGNLCKRGAFETLFVHGKNRLETPLIKEGGRMRPASWEEALAKASEGLKEAISRYGSDKVAVLASPKLTNEENYLAQKLARLAMKTNNIGNSISVPENNALGEYFGKNSSTCSFGDISHSDLIFIYGSDVFTEYPVAALKIKGVVEAGSRLIMVNHEPTRLDAAANMTLKISRRMAEELLQTMLNYVFANDLIDDEFINRRTLGLRELKKHVKPYSMDNWSQAFWVKPAKIIEFIHMYVRAKNPMIIVNADTISHGELSLLCNLALVTGNVARKGAGIIALRSHGNSQGQIDMGVSPEHLPGQEPIFDSTPRQILETLWGASIPEMKGLAPEDMAESIAKSKIKGLIVIGAGSDDIDLDLLQSGRTFTVVITPVFKEEMAQADVVFPGTTFAETDGTFTSSEQRVQRLYEAVAAKAGKHTWQIICDLASRLGYEMQYSSAADIFGEISKVIPAYSDISFNHIPGDGIKLSSCNEQATFISPHWLDKLIKIGLRESDSS